MASASDILRWGSESSETNQKRSYCKARSVATSMTLARSSPSCTLDPGFFIMVRTSDFSPTVFTVDVPLGRLEAAPYSDQPQKSVKSRSGFVPTPLSYC